MANFEGADHVRRRVIHPLLRCPAGNHLPRQADGSARDRRIPLPASTATSMVEGPPSNLTNFLGCVPGQERPVTESRTEITGGESPAQPGTATSKVNRSQWSLSPVVLRAPGNRPMTDDQVSENLPSARNVDGAGASYPWLRVLRAA